MTDNVFPGRSELARRMRALDWSRSVLGPPENWSQPLRTSVSTCLDCAFPIVLWWGPELAVLYNDEYAAILGPIKDAEALGERGSVVWAEIWDVIGPMLSQVMESGAATRSRDLLLHIERAGYAEEAYFSFSYSPIHDGHGKVGGIFCPVIETTEKVIGERRLRTLRDLAARCQGSETEVAACTAAAEVLAGNAQDVPFALIYRLDPKTGKAHLDATAGIEAGAPAAPWTVDLSAAGNDPWTLRAVAESGRAAVLTDLAQRFVDRPSGAWTSPPHTALVLPMLLPGQDRPRVLVTAVSPMRALDEAYRTFFGLVATQIASGLADARALESERRRAAALAEIDQAKTVFFSNVSHEFRTPLTLMLGPLEDVLAGAHGALPAEAAASLDVAHRNSRRLLKLVNALLDFSRLEAGRVDASFEPVDLAALTAELCSVFRSAVEKAGLRLLVDCPPLPEPVYVDRDMWEKLVLNLLSNAFKFTFEGEIEVSLRWLGGRAELCVRDTGVGIPEADVPRVFQRFHRVRNTRSRTHEGSGIGLALVQELARIHGGEVRVASREGEGSRFSVQLPAGHAHLPAEHVGRGRTLSSTGTPAAAFLDEALRWLPDEGEPREASELSDLPAPGATGAPVRILVVDDNADMRDYLGRMLDHRYRFQAVPDGQAALDSIHQELPDLVLTDVMMPRLDGFGLLAALRADRRTRTLPVILLSARAGEEARIEGLAAGADDYLVKPFSARELLARISSQLQLARLRRENEELLRETDRRKDEFLAMLAHELRGPLAPIRNSLELIKLGQGSPADLTITQSILDRQVAHLQRLVDDLLDVSRVTRNKLQLRRQRVTLRSVVAQAVETCEPALASHQHQLALDLPAAEVVLDGDPVRLAQVFSNVLNNACKYTEPGGRIEIAARVRGAEVEVSIRDNGMGIGPELLPQVFDLFRQGDRTLERAHGGLGIGLTLVQRLVELHGGSVAAFSEGAGRGTEVRVTLPVAERATAPVTHRAVQPASGPRRRILVVDDNVDGANSLAQLMQFAGHEPHVAHDGHAAVEACERLDPDVVVLDIGLPGLNGYDVARRLRAGSSRRAMLIALTGWGQEEDRRKSREAGFDHHLTKPVDLHILLALLGETPLRRAADSSSLPRHDGAREAEGR